MTERWMARWGARLLARVGAGCSLTPAEPPSAPVVPRAEHRTPEQPFPPSQAVCGRPGCGKPMGRSVSLYFCTERCAIEWAVKGGEPLAPVVPRAGAA